jgi:hypothetical protein
MVNDAFGLFTKAIDKLEKANEQCHKETKSAWEQIRILEAQVDISMAAGFKARTAVQNIKDLTLSDKEEFTEVSGQDTAEVHFEPEAS